ncbi:protocatechuate 3,4-dioxygenase subunit alpha [Achromobacter sp. NPDC008082]|uniref:protocatechuate 3,4-dioxygenase subunit alpha n=1 Tax=Achromobacter sp. NPDC008082 TaxID=3363888 RepID=UPI0036EF7327
MLYATASQTVGPYLHIGLADRYCEDLTLSAPTLQDRLIVIKGRVLDGLGAPVPDGMVEIWQANPHGRYDHPEDTRDALPLIEGFTGFGRVPTGPDGSFRFVTVKPGSVPDLNGVPQAPHILVSVFTRGLLKHVATRMYFPDEAAANASDDVLRQVPPARRNTLIARADEDRELHWDIVLQGDNETVFFDI